MGCLPRNLVLARAGDAASGISLDGVTFSIGPVPHKHMQFHQLPSSAEAEEVSSRNDFQRTAAPP
jgi:hypothetical protein